MYARLIVRQISTQKNTIYKDRFKDKVAVVVGSTSGIGLSIAHRFAAEGANVVICSRKQANVTKALETFKNQSVIGTTCHVQNSDDRQKLLQLTSEDFVDKTLDVNIKTPLLLTQLFEPQMKDNGSIVYIGSVTGEIPFNMLGMYSVSKAALIALTRCIAAEAGPRIRVNCINAGPCETKFGSVLHTNKAIESAIMKLSIAKEFAQPEDVASLATFLCSDNGSHFHGEVIRLAGGLGARFGNF